MSVERLRRVREIYPYVRVCRCEGRYRLCVRDKGHVDPATTARRVWDLYGLGADYHVVQRLKVMKIDEKEFTSG